MRYQLFGVLCSTILLSACAGTEVEETVAQTESLQTLREPAAAIISPAVRASITRAGLRLCDLQADRFGDSARNGLVDDDPDDGGWDWQVMPSSNSHSVDASPTNLFGATGLGLWAAVQLGISRPRVHAALLETYQGIRQNPEISAAPDIVLLTLLSDRYADERYAELARERYDARIAVAGDAGLLSAEILAARHAAGADGLIAYDLGWFALGALALHERYPAAGYLSDFDRYTGTVLEDLTSSTPAFDYSDPHEPYYVTGLAWSMLASSWNPRTRAIFEDLRSRLMDEQLSSGAWPHNADYPEANVQATAHALIALGLAKRGGAMLKRTGNSAVAWITSQQNDNGGWSYAPDQEFPLLDAEASLGIYLVRSATPAIVPNEVLNLALALPDRRSASVPPPAAPADRTER